MPRALDVNPGTVPVSILCRALAEGETTPITAAFLLDAYDSMPAVALVVPKPGRYLVSAEWINTDQGESFIGAEWVDVKGETSLKMNMGTLNVFCYSANLSSIVGGSTGFNFDNQSAILNEADIAVTTFYKTPNFSVDIVPGAANGGTSVIAYLGNGNLVNFPQVPSNASFYASAFEAKGNTDLASGDVYGIKIPARNSVAWVLVTAAYTEYSNGYVDFVYRESAAGSDIYSFHMTSFGEANCNEKFTIYDPEFVRSFSIANPMGFATDGTGFYGLSVPAAAGSEIVAFNSGAVSINSIASTYLSNAKDVALNQAGTTIYVTDAGCSCVRVFSTAGVSITSITGDTSVSLVGPTGLAVGPNGNLYVTDVTDNMVKVINPTTNTGVRNLGSSGSADGQFNNPLGITVDGTGNIYVADTGNGRIQKFNSSYVFVKKWGTYGNSYNGQFESPADVAVSPDGQKVYVVDSTKVRVQSFDGEGRMLNVWGTSGTTPALSWWEFNAPQRIDVLPNGHICVSDTSNNRVGEFIDTPATVFPLN